jgi:hypothetical protein
VDETALYPFAEDADRLLRYCKLPPHTGVGRVTRLLGGRAEMAETVARRPGIIP